MTDLPNQLPSPEAEVSVDAMHALRERVSDLEEQLDAGVLSFEAQQRRLLVDELKIRVSNKQLLPIFAVSVIVFMGLVLWHGVHSLNSVEMLKNANGFALVVAIIVAPVLSITTITVVLLFGSFRGYRDRDIDGIAPLAIDAAKAGISGNS